MTLRVLSLFSGAGGADLALEAAGMSVAALCEIEPHARAVLREHWPDVPLHGDVQTLDGTQYRGKVDIVVGGSPCQDLSVAGKRAGLTEGSGTRSSLFHDQVRIWQESQATYLIWENVKGAFSSSQGADFAAVLSAIVGRTVPVRRDGWSNAGVVCGPTAVAAWRLLDLQHFGVPQRRERIVVLAARAGGVDPAEVLAVSQSLRWDSAPRFQAREGTAAPALQSIAPTLDAGEWRGPNRNQGGVIAVGNHAEGWAGSALTYDARGNGQQTPFRMTAIGEYTTGGIGSTLKAVDHKEPKDLVVVDKNTAHVEKGAVSPTLKTDLAHDMGPVVLRVVSPTLTAANDPSRSPQSSEVTAQVAAILQAEQPRTLAFKVHGGVEVDSAGKAAGKGYLGSEEVAFTLSGTQDQQIHQGVAPTITMGAHPAAPVLNGQDAVQFAEALISAQPGVPRRLMPIECERLMGWPDSWTRWGVNEKGVRYELADTPRYKLCGNGIGREWMEWVAVRLMEAEGLTSNGQASTLEGVGPT